MNRHIILREHAPLTDMLATPQDDYLAYCNGSLNTSPIRLRTNEDGFIVTGGSLDLQFPCALVLGDSVIENYWISEGSRTCDLTEQVLSIYGKHCRILNAGTTGATTLQLYNTLVNKGIVQKPAVVVLVAGVIDTLIGAARRGMWQDAISPATSSRISQDFVKEREIILYLFVSTCKSLSIPLVLTTVGHAPSAPSCYGMRNSPEIASAWPRLINGLNNSIRNFSRANDIPLIDFDVAMEGREDLFYDGLHANSEGCAVMAEGMVRALLTIMQERVELFHSGARPHLP